MIDTDSIRPNAVSVLIGPNGSGKSRLLRKLCGEFIGRGEHVIAIAPTIYDRFKFRGSKRFRFLGARQGRNVTTRVVRDALIRTWSESDLVLKNLTTALYYTKFEPCVGIGLFNLNLEDIRAVSESIPPEEMEALHSALLKWEKRGMGNSVLRLYLDSHSLQEVDNLSFAILAKHERLLRKHHIARIEYFLYRDSRPIPLLEACSGELMFITTVAFISTEIQRRSIIAIDEPDTSLHPTWQRDYVRTLLDLFYRYEPRILISTHSPIIISAAEYSKGDSIRSELFVYQMSNGQPQPFEYAGLSLEAMYDKLFGLITPKNHYLSQQAVSLLNSLNSGDRTLNQVVHELEDLRSKSYDESQKGVIAKVEEMARQVEMIRQRKGRR